MRLIVTPERTVSLVPTLPEVTGKRDRDVRRPPSAEGSATHLHEKCDFRCTAS
jgi:hypothetical protein